MRTTLLVVLTLVALVLVPATTAAAGGQAPTASTSAESAAGSATVGDEQPPGVGLSSANAAPNGAHADEHDACEAVAGDRQRENPENDTLGWEDGCWYDDPIDVTPDDGLNDSELAAVVARTMARVEHVRGLEFEETVPVEVITREEYGERNADGYANATRAQRLHQNVKHEALFFVDEESDALAQMRTNQAGSVLGYYSPTQDRIVVISDSPDTLELGELTLAHELVHAVQDQHYNISEYDRSTTERDKATLGLIEGDAHYTETLYEERCDAGWECPSIESSQPDIPEGFHWGLYFVNYQPYSDGPGFVEAVRDDGGWEAVDRLYEEPPASSEQVISPEKYPDERPADVTVADRSDDRWRILGLENGMNYAEFGQVGLSTMFVYPTYEGSPRFVSQQEFHNTGPDSDLDPLDYSNSYTDGWAGDRLYPYVTDDSAETNETGYVWKTVWDTDEDAVEFAEGYEEMLEYRDAGPVDGREGTYRIPEEERFDDAFYVNRTGDTVVVVNAPTVDQLDGVRAGAAPETTPTASPSADGRPDDGTSSTDESTADGRTDDGTSSTDEGTDGPLPTTTTAPGAGAILAVVATGLVAFVLGRR